MSCKARVCHLLLGNSSILMMAKSLLVSIAVFFILQPAMGLGATQNSTTLKLDQFNERYMKKSWRGFRGRTEVLTSIYDWFLEIDRSTLGNRSKALHDDAAEIFKAPLNESAWSRYLRDFPREFSEFGRIFCLDYPKELTRQPDLFIMLIDDAVHMDPQSVIVLVLALSKDKPAFGDCTAGYRLQDLIANLFCKYDDLTVSEMKNLSQAGQHNVIDYICAVENIEGYQALDCIMNKLKEKSRVALLRSFEEAKKRAMSLPRH